MIGWGIMIALALLVFAGLGFLGGTKRNAFEFVAAAIVLAFAGYQWQGRPNLPGAPGKAAESREEVTASLIDMRKLMDRNFTSAKRYIVPSDSYARRGDYVGAVQILRGGLNAEPRNADLWTAVGLDLMLAADGKLPPAAKLAFDKARALDPRHPGPVYFTGLAALQQGNPEDALILWSNLLQGDYRAGEWREKLRPQAEALAQMLSGAMAMQQAPSQDRTGAADAR